MKLTEREREILCCMWRSDKDICKKLTLELATVKAHVHNIISKLCPAKNRTQALIIALKRKIINLEDLT